MKTFTLAVFMLFSLSAFAQLSELSIGLGSNIPFLPRKKQSIQKQSVLPTTGFATYTTSISVDERYELAPGMQANLSFKYKLKNNFFLASGWAVLYSRFQQKAKVNLNESYTGAIVSQSEFTNTGNLGKTRLLQMQIPVLAGMTTKSDKFVFQAGFIVSSVMKADVYESSFSNTLSAPIFLSRNPDGMIAMSDIDNGGVTGFPSNYTYEERRVDARERFEPLSIGFIARVGYKISEHVTLDIFGQPNLTNLYKPNGTNSPPLRLTSFGINANYILKRNN